MQVPPTYSAVKVNGARAYELRRNDEEVTLKAKPVHVEEIELLSFDRRRCRRSYVWNAGRERTYALSGVTSAGHWAAAHI